MKNTTINSILKSAIIIGLVFVTFIPLYVANPLFFPFITGKAFAFRIIVEIIFALWLILVLRERGTHVVNTDKSVVPKYNNLSIAVTVFTLIALIADLFGLNPLRSIWSNYERMEGWMTIVHLWGYFMVLISVLTTRENWNKFLTVELGSATVVALYGLFQYAGIALTHQGSRVDGSLGNSEYMAIFMLVNVFIALYLLFSDSNYKRFAITDGYKKLNFYWITIIALIIIIPFFAAPDSIKAFFSAWGDFMQHHILWSLLALIFIVAMLVKPYFLLPIFFSFILFQTATRGTILAWIAAIMVSCFVYSVFGRKKTGQSNLTRILTASVIIIFILAGYIFYRNKDAKWIQADPVLSRLASISIKDTKTQARGFIWPMAIKGIFESPKTSIIGVGQENFNYIFNSHYNPLMWRHEQWFDRAHNVYLDWLVAGGLLGLLSYLALFLFSFIFITKSQLNIADKSILTGLLVGFMIHNVFVFDNQTSYVMFFTILALVHSLYPTKKLSWFKNFDKSATEDSITVRDYIFVPVIVILLAVGFYFINVRPIQANSRLILALQACSNPKYAATKYFKNALDLNQYVSNQEIREHMIGCSSNIIQNQQVPQNTKIDFYNLTKEEIENQIKATPDDARIYIIGGGFFDYVNDFQSATPLLEKANDLSPNKQTIIYELSLNYLNIGKEKEAVDLMEKAYLSATDNPNAKINYVSTLIGAKQSDKAIKLFGDDKIDGKSIFEDPKIISAYMLSKQYDKAIAIYNSLIKQDPEKQETYTALAYAYLLNKQDYLSVSTLKIAAQKFPLVKPQIEELIKQIQEGKIKLP